MDSAGVAPATEGGGRATSDLGMAAARLAAARATALGLSAATRAEAQAVVAASGYRHLKEETLWNEWRNDLISAKPNSARLREATLDPDACYAEWVVGRAADPYRVSERASREVAVHLGFETMNLLLVVRWPQELSWAHRLRAAADDKVVMVATLFLTRAQRNASEEFSSMADAWEQLTDDPGYGSSPAHDYDPDEIRAGCPDHGFRPIFLRRGYVAYAERLDKTDAKTMRLLADNSREAERVDLGRLASRRAAAVAVHGGMARMAGVIQVAIESGLDSGGLAAAHDRFVGLLYDGEVAVRSGGLPYREFLDWLRTSKHPKGEPMGGADALVASAEVLHASSSSRRWVETLPADYRPMGAADPLVFWEWAGPILRGTREAPRDLVSDYGFHLVARSHRIAPS